MIAYSPALTGTHCGLPHTDGKSEITCVVTYQAELSAADGYPSQ